MIKLQVRSQALNNERPVWVREPQAPISCENLVVFLDGEFYLDGVGAEAIIEKLRAQGEIADAWFAFVSHHSMEARWVECPCYPAFNVFVGSELPVALAAHFPALQAVRNRTLVGLSYTGLAASYIAKETPGVFSKVISQSGSYWSNDCLLISQYQQAVGPLSTEFYLDVGSKETEKEIVHKEGHTQQITQIEGVRTISRCADSERMQSRVQGL